MKNIKHYLNAAAKSISRSVNCMKNNLGTFLGWLLHNILMLLCRQP